MKAISKRGKRAVLLLRASVNAEDRSTLITQESEAREYANKEGIEIVAVFVDDGKSGYKPGTHRPGHDAAMAYIQRKQAEILLVWKLDRMVRNLMSFAEEWNIIQRAGGEFVSVVESWADTTTPQGRLMLMIVAAFAEMESEMKRDRALPFHKYRAENGLAPGGPRPFGYQRVNGKLLTDESEALAVKLMAEMILSGETLYSVVQAQELMGSRNTKLSSHGVKRILTSPTIAGIRIHDGKEYPGNWAPILDRETWDKLRVMLGDPARRTNFTDGRPAYLLSGIMVCGKVGCGASMRRKAHPDGLRYRCGKCGNGIPMAMADEAVTAFLMDAVDPAAWRALKEQGRAYDPEVIAGLEAELAELDDMREAGELSLERYRRQNRAVQERIAAATNAEPIDLPEIESLQEGWQTLSLMEQRAVITTLLDSITLDKWSPKTRLGRERIQITRAC